MTHTHDIFDTDKRMTIDPVTRVITNQSANKVLLMQGDHNSERITFEVPRFVEGHDMSLSTVAQIHFENGESKDYYEADDLQVDPENDDEVIFSWLISRNATKNSGALKFHIKFRCYDGEEVVYEWNSASYDKFSIGAALDNGKVVVEQYSDAIIALEERVENVEKASGATLDTTLTMEGCPADAKAVGDALADCALKSELPEGFSGSWNDLEDKPFYEIDNRVVLVNETTDTFNKYAGTEISFNGDEDFSEGVNYTLYVDGTPYTCRVGTYHIEGSDCPALLAGDNDEFKVVCDYGLFAMGYGFLAEGTLTIMLVKGEAEVKTLDPKYLPDTVATKEYVDERAGYGGGGLDLIITTDGDVYTPNITLEEAVAIFEEKGWIQGIVKKDMGNGWVYSFSIHTVSSGGNTMTFTAHNEAFGYISWNSDGMSFVAGA